MSTANGNGHARLLGAGVRTSRAELLRLREENRLAAERLRARRLARAYAAEHRRELRESLSLDWVTPYAELLDLARHTGDPLVSGPAAYWHRKAGRNWPVYQTEAELSLLRAPARLLVATNTYAQGMVHGLSSYVVSSGCTYRIAKRQKRQQVEQEVIDAAQRVVDEILRMNQWHGGEQPAMEPELFERSLEDGEFLLTHHPRDDGWTDFRTQECEQLTQPPGSDAREYGFGVCTPRDDVQRVLKYYFQFGEGPAEGDEYDPDEVTHYRRNVRRSMKRGVTEFCFGAYDAIYLAGRLQTNLGDTAAQQAAIVAVRQHETAAEEDVQAFVGADAEFTRTDPVTGAQEPIRRHRRGSWEDIPKGMQYVPGPIATSTPIHIQVLQACLRGAVVKWNGFEWLISADASNNNYASSLTAESPFVRRVLQEQRGYREAFKKPIWYALRHYVRTHGLRVPQEGGSYKVCTWEELEPLIDLLVEAPSPETRNKLVETQRAQIEIPLDLDSRQQFAQRQGRDYDQIEADNRVYQEEHGTPGQPLPTEVPPDQGGGPGGGGGVQTPAPKPTPGEEPNDPFAAFESLLESFAADLLEAGPAREEGAVWKGQSGRWFTKKNGRVVPAKAPSGSEGGAKKPAAKEKPAPQGKGAKPEPKRSAAKPAAKAAKPDPAATVAAVKAQLSGDAAKLTPAAVKKLNEQLGTLKKDQVVALAKEHAAKLGKTKADAIAGLLARAKEKKKQADAEKKAAKGKPAKKPAPAPKEEPTPAAPPDVEHLTKLRDRYKRLHAEAKAELDRAFPEAAKTGNRPQFGRGYDDRRAVVDEYAQRLADAEAELARAAPKEEPKPTPAPDDGPHPAARKLVLALNAAPLTDDQREHYGRALARVVKTMPKAALDRVHANLEGVTFHKSIADIPEAMIAQLVDQPGLDAEQREFVRNQYAFLKKKRIGGVYMNGFRHVHVDGDNDAESRQPGRHVEGFDKAPGLYAHEFTHAIDGPGHEISFSPEWADAFKSEIDQGTAAYDRGEPPLSYYATTKPQEGMAEFGRLVYASDVPHAQIAREFPKCTAVFKARGLWPTEERAGTRGATLPEVFEERVEVGTDGGHADVLKRDGAAPAGWGSLAEMPPQPGERTHDVKLPRSRKRLNVGPMRAALEQMGYQFHFGEGKTDLKSKTTFYGVTDPAGNKRMATADELAEIVYRGARAII